MDKITVLGPKGTFSDMAARRLDYKIIYCDSHDEVIIKLVNKKADFALVAFENQLTGTIIENLDSIIKYNLKIIKEIVIPVHHNLCALSDSKDIKKIYSHPQGFFQCRGFLDDKYEKIEMKSTAESFEYIANNKLLDSACIGPELAAEIYGLEIIKKNIEDFHHNQTRFFVLAKKENTIRGNKASIIFKAKHLPGSLVKSLQRLAKYDINLTKIESRPLPEHPWEYLFYCDLECADKEILNKALNEMELTLVFLKRLGTYDAERG